MEIVVDGERDVVGRVASHGTTSRVPIYLPSEATMTFQCIISIIQIGNMYLHICTSPVCTDFCAIVCNFVMCC